MLFSFMDNFFAELARRGNQKYNKSVKLLRFNNHICYVGKIDAKIKPFHCSNSDTFFRKVAM